MGESAPKNERFFVHVLVDFRLAVGTRQNTLNAILFEAKVRCISSTVGLASSAVHKPIVR